jgi:hypothetical protein
VLVATIPPPLPLGRRLDLIRAHAHRYVEAGWAAFLLATDSSGGKIPARNCPRCDPRDPAYAQHDREACECLTCHGFYAATLDPDRFDHILVTLPHGQLALRTGRASRLLVIDAEAHSEGPGTPSGLEALDRWESLVGGWSLPATLVARSVSGGLHLYYRLPVDAPPIGCGRVLPGVDIKADLGYVGAVSGVTDRSWVDTSVRVAEAPAELLSWLASTKRRGLGGSGGGSWGGGGGGLGGGGYKPPGYDFRAFERGVVPGGHRDIFINEALFRARKAGATLIELEQLARHHWERFEQPPDCHWEMPWSAVVGKIPYVYHSVTPDELDPATKRGRRWLARATRHDVPTTDTRVGRVTLARRSTS